MTLKVSTGLRNKLLVTGSMKAILAAGFIDIYDGAIPASADDAPVGNKLCRIYTGFGQGLNFADTAVDGILAKNPNEAWGGGVNLSGTATYYRHVTANDSGALSTTDARLQGTIAQAGADMNFSDVNLVQNGFKTLDYYVVALGTL